MSLAECHEQLQQWQRALEHYQRLMDLHGSFEELARLGVARCLAARGQNKDALDQYDRLVNSEASLTAATALLESARLHLAGAEAALADNDALQASHARHQARKRLNRVVILYDLPQLQHITQPALLELGLVTAQQDDLAQARRSFQQLIQQHPQTPWAQLARAELALLAGKRGDGTFLLRKLVQGAGQKEAVEYARRRLRALGASP
jgi:tetratricopeptide (TPR) repeat protein